MLISVVIGALNEEKYIAKTLSTVRVQRTNHEFEVLVGDGYSEDNTVKIAKSFGAKVVKEKNRSAAWERQAAANIAKGKIIVFTDADAIVPENWLEQIAVEFEKDPKLVMLYGPVYFSDTPSWEKSLSKIVMSLYLAILALLGFHNPIGSNIAVRANAFRKANGFNTSLITAEDLDLVHRMKKQGKLKFSRNIHLHVSARRVKKWGYLKFTLFHILNGLRYQFTGKGKTDYEPVR
ncbi:MAG TPA: glycosyltransferase [archaeon]|nr:glycosyltransferase [archaeon]